MFRQDHYHHGEVTLGDTAAKIGHMLAPTELLLACRKASVPKAVHELIATGSRESLVKCSSLC